MLPVLWLTSEGEHSLRRQGRLACARHVLAQAGGLQAGMERSGRQGEDGVDRVVYLLQQAVQYRWHGPRG